MTAIAYETFHLGLRTTRRFIRVPANFISIIFFPLIQLLVFSQLYQDIVQLPGFGGQSSYLAYLAPGQVAFTAFMAVAWSGYGLLVEYRSGYIDKLRASPIRHWTLLRHRTGTPGAACDSFPDARAGPGIHIRPHVASLRLAPPRVIFAVQPGAQAGARVPARSCAEIYPACRPLRGWRGCASNGPRSSSSSVPSSLPGSITVRLHQLFHALTHSLTHPPAPS